MRNQIAKLLEESAKIKLNIADNQTKVIEAMVNLISSSYKNGGKVVLCGNGGSAADAQHIAGELIGRFAIERHAFPAIALTTDTSIITALANDYGYDTVFKRQIEGLVTEKDVVIGISTSGNSPNIIAALKAAKLKGAKTIGFSGSDGGKLAGVSDLLMAVPSNKTARIQESHITVAHIICELVERELAGEGILPKPESKPNLK